jgi:hypothetical protein
MVIGLSLSGEAYLKPSMKGMGACMLAATVPAYHAVRLDPIDVREDEGELGPYPQ